MLRVTGGGDRCDPPCHGSPNAARSHLPLRFACRIQRSHAGRLELRCDPLSSGRPHTIAATSPPGWCRGVLYKWAPSNQTSVPSGDPQSSNTTPAEVLRHLALRSHAVVASSIPWNRNGAARPMASARSAAYARSHARRYQLAIVCGLRFAGRVVRVARRAATSGPALIGALHRAAPHHHIIAIAFCSPRSLWPRRAHPDSWRKPAAAP